MEPNIEAYMITTIIPEGRTEPAVFIVRDKELAELYHKLFKGSTLKKLGVIG